MFYSCILFIFFINDDFKFGSLYKSRFCKPPRCGYLDSKNKMETLKMATASNAAVQIDFRNVSSRHIQSKVEWSRCSFGVSSYFLPFLKMNLKVYKEGNTDKNKAYS